MHDTIDSLYNLHQLTFLIIHPHPSPFQITRDCIFDGAAPRSWRAPHWIPRNPSQSLAFQTQCHCWSISHRDRSIEETVILCEPIECDPKVYILRKKGRPEASQNIESFFLLIVKGLKSIAILLQKFESKVFTTISFFIPFSVSYCCWVRLGWVGFLKTFPIVFCT